MALCAVVVAGGPSLAEARALTTCGIGQMVTDRENKTGIIVSAGNNLCQVEYPDGQVYGWIYWNLRPAAPAQSGSPKVGTGPPATIVGPVAPVGPPGNNAAAPTILRAGPAARTLVYRTDERGHVALT